MPVNLASQWAEIRKITVQSHPRQIVCKTLSQENPTQNGAGRVAQVVEHLDNKHEDLSSNSSTIRKKKPGTKNMYYLIPFAESFSTEKINLV
jgi:hypothetical protein